MGFQTLPHELGKLIERTSSGEIQLPDFQRGYVWDDERVRELLVTVAVGHPMGVVLMLETGSPEIHFQAKPIEGTSPAEGVTPKHLLLDGQQRLTSLTQAFLNGRVETSDKGRRSYFINMAVALEEHADLADAIESFPADGVRRTNFNKDVVLDVSTPEKQIAEGYFPISEVFDASGTVWVLKWAEASGAGMAGASAFITDILEPMKKYAIPAIELDQQTTMAAVTTVFEKVNQGGVKLTVFELLTAKFAGDRQYFDETGEAFRLREDWEQTREALDEHEVLEKFENDDFLQAVTLASTLAGPKATTARKEDVLKLTLSEYRTWAPQVRDALGWVAGFLDSQHIHTGYDLPYPKQVVPLAVLRVHMGTQTDAWGINAKISQWFWSGILGELYGGAIETRFARDVEQVPAWAAGDGPVPKTVDDAYFVESRLLSLRTRNSAAYKGIYALLMGEGAKDWAYNQSFEKKHYIAMQVDIHHIFPKAWCDKFEIAWEYRESIINKTPLAKTTNIALSGNAPSTYRQTLRTKAQADDATIDAVIAAHQIDTALLWADDFDQFFADRSTRLCHLIESAMGKPVAHDLTEGA